jgi:cytochrome c-type biogenesis protein CcmH/NrfG
LLAVVYYSAGKVEKSIEQLNELLAKDSNNTRALMMLAVMHAQLKQMEKAQNAYERALCRETRLCSRPEQPRVGFIRKTRTNRTRPWKPPARHAPFSQADAVDRG